MTAALTTLLNINLSDNTLLTQALTHKSHPDSTDYERLEFLGDRVLNLSVATMLFNKFPDYSEGELAKHHAALVREETLADIAKIWQLDTHIRVGKSAQTEGNLQSSILADVVEALLGVIFLDTDFKTAADVVVQFWTPLIDKVDIIDAKSKLQELLQAHGHPLPTYKVLKSTGKDHDKTFVINVSSALGEAEGIGASKQKAAQIAAKNLLIQLEKTT